MSHPDEADDELMPANSEREVVITDADQLAAALARCTQLEQENRELANQVSNLATCEAACGHELDDAAAKVRELEARCAALQREQEQLTKELKERETDSCLVCGNIRPFVVFHANSGVGVCQRCVQNARVPERLSADYPLVLVRWDGEQPYAALSRAEFERLDQAQAALTEIRAQLAQAQAHNNELRSQVGPLADEVKRAALRSVDNLRDALELADLRAVCARLQEQWKQNARQHRHAQHTDPDSQLAGIDRAFARAFGSCADELEAALAAVVSRQTENQGKQENTQARVDIP